MKYYIVDAFTSEPFGGNPAGVVLLDSVFPADKLMQQVAAELRYSETAFVQRNGPTEFTVRYFTCWRGGPVRSCDYRHLWGAVPEGHLARRRFVHEPHAGR